MTHSEPSSHLPPIGQPDTARAGAARLWFGMTAAAFLIYSATMLPGLGWGDTANAQIRVLLGRWTDHQYLVRSHTPFYWVAFVLHWLGIEAARAATMVSVGAGAVTVGNVAVVVLMLVRRPVCAVPAGLVLMGSHALWHQATMAEVMTLSTALMSLELLLLVRFCQGGRFGWWAGAAMVNGLGVATHSLGMLLWPAHLVVLLSIGSRLRRGRGRAVALLVASWCCGAWPLGLVFWKGLSVHSTAWAVLHDMFVGRFGPQIFNLGVTAGVVVRMGAYAAYALATPVALAAFVGIGRLWADRKALVSRVLLMGFVVHGVFAVRYVVPDQHAFMLHTVVFLAVFAGIGLDGLLDRFAIRGWGIAALTMLSLTAPIAYEVFPEIMRSKRPGFMGFRRLAHRDPYAWFLKPWRGSDRSAELFAREVLAAVPQDAVLAVDSAPVPALIYVQIRDDFRKDVRVCGGERFQTWLPSDFDLGGADGLRAIEQGRMFAVVDEIRWMPEAVRHWKLRFIPEGPVFRLVRADGK